MTLFWVSKNSVNKIFLSKFAAESSHDDQSPANAHSLGIRL
jgi:hypothetical protein